MAHSYRHAPMTGWSTARSEKLDKRAWNRRVRHRNRVRLQQERECLPLRAVSDVQTGAKDGKQRFDPAAYPKLLRK